MSVPTIIRSRRWLALLAISALSAALALGLCACSGSSVAVVSGSATVSGWVCLGPYGTASAGAQVSARGPSGDTVTGTADADGAFSLTKVEAGNVVVVYSNRIDQGVERVTVLDGGSVQVGIACKVSPARLTLRLCVEGSLTPRTGTDVTLTYLDYGGADPVPRADTTDTQGEMVATDLVPGDYRIDVAGADPNAHPTISLTPGSDELWIDPGCYDPITVGSVRGRICNPLNSEPVENVVVELEVASDDLRETTSDADGRYNFAAVPPGSYTLTIKPPLQQPTDLSVDVVAGEATVMPSYCTADPVGSIAGFVCDAISGAPTAGISVKLDITGEPARFETTNSGGRFRFADVPLGTHSVTYTVPSGGAVVLPATVVENEELTLTAPECNSSSFGSVTGRVCNPADEQPVAGIAVELRIPADLRETTSDNDGYFTFELVPAGTFDVAVLPPGENAVIRSATVVAGQATVVPSPECGSGTLPNPATLTGIACVGITSSYELPGAKVTVDFNPGLKTTFSALDGSWTVNNLAAGTVDVTITRGSWTATTQATLIADQTTDIGMSPCVGPGTRVAIVTGVWDDLTQPFLDLGLPMRHDGTSIVDAGGVFDIIDGTSNAWVDNFAADVTNLQAYDIVIFTSGYWMDRLAEGYCCSSPPIDSDPCIFPPNPPDPAPPPRDCSTLPVSIALDNIETYLNGGGKVIASDWAYDIARMQFLGYIDFYNNDTMGLRAACGHAPLTAIPIVLDQDLAVLLGGSTATIEYEAGFNKWIALDPVADQTNPYLVTFLSANIYVYDFPIVSQSCDASGGGVPLFDSPLLVATPVGENGGLLVFSTFRYLDLPGADNAEILRQIILTL